MLIVCDVKFVAYVASTLCCFMIKSRFSFKICQSMAIFGESIYIENF